MYLLPCIKVSRKTNIPSSKHWWPIFSPSLDFHTEQNSIMVKAIINAFDHFGIMFSFTDSRRNITVKNDLFFQEINSISEFPGRKFWLPTLSNRIFRLQICYLPRLISNPNSVWVQWHVLLPF